MFIMLRPSPTVSIDLYDVSREHGPGAVQVELFGPADPDDPAWDVRNSKTFPTMEVGLSLLEGAFGGGDYETVENFSSDARVPSAPIVGVVRRISPVPARGA